MKVCNYMIYWWHIDYKNIKLEFTNSRYGLALNCPIPLNIMANSQQIFTISDLVAWNHLLISLLCFTYTNCSLIFCAMGHVLEF